MKIVSLFTEGTFQRVMDPIQEERLEKLGEYHGGYIGGDDYPKAAIEKIAAAGGADILVSSWGSPALTEEIIKACGSLKLLAYAAGSVKGQITKQMIESGIHATTTAPAIAVSVAEFTIGQILMFTRRIHLNRICSREEWKAPGVSDPCAYSHVELYGRNIGIVGAGFVGRKVIELLNAFGFNILVYDPYLSDEDALKLNVRKAASVKEIAADCMVLSLHVPSIPETDNMINAEVLAALPDEALLVNTARGSAIDENALISELKRERIFACLDVSDPEPPVAESELYNLKNCFLTPHFAGGCRQNNKRQSEYMADEVEAMVNGKPLIYEVTAEKYDIMA